MVVPYLLERSNCILYLPLSLLSRQYMGTMKYTFTTSSSIMFVGTFSVRNGRNTLPPSSPLQTIPRANPLVSVATNEAVSSAAYNIEFIEESQLHIVTLPPFVGGNNDQNDDGYPSPLHQIHILPLLTSEEAAKLLLLARNHATENQSWDRQDSSRHVSYPTVDFAIEESW
jgi:hypothetical protein